MAIGNHKTLLALIDQASASIISFGGALALLLFGKTQDFSAFSVYSTYSILLVSILNSAFGATFQIHLASLQKDEQSECARLHYSAQILICFAMFFLMLGAIRFLPLGVEIEFPCNVWLALMPATAWAREVNRTVCVANAKVGRLALEGSLALLVFCTLIAYFLLTKGNLTLGQVSGSTVVATGIPAVAEITGMGGLKWPVTYLSFIGIIKKSMLWSVPGGILAWLGSQAYISIAMIIGGSSFVALLSAARLAGSPVSSIQAAISRIALTQSAQEFRINGRRGVFRATLANTKKTILTHTFYWIMFFIAYLLIGNRLPSKYSAVVEFVPLVAALVLISSARGIWVGASQAVEGFKFSFWMSALGVIITALGLFVVSVFFVGVAQFLAALILSEALMLSMFILRVRNDHEN